MKVEPILIFAGQAIQAIDLYKKAFNAEVKILMRQSDANPEDFQYNEEHKDFVYHSQLQIGKQIIMLADDPEMDAKSQGKPPFLIDLVVMFDTDEELQAAYSVLSDGATITSPLCSQTYCSLTCALIDKFGGRWQLMSGYKG